MDRFERLKAALKGQEVDRIPVNMWMHFSTADMDPRSLAETQVAFQEKYDYDFIKLMPFGLYSAQPWGAGIKVFCRTNEPPILEKSAIADAKEWGTIEELSPTFGSWGNALLTAQHTAKLTGGKTPFLQTLFSPLTTARKIAGDRIFADMKQEPALFHQALQNITNTTVAFVKENIKAGVSGFFFATQCAEYSCMSQAEYAEFGEKYDLQVIKAYQDETWFNVAHIHGQNGMLDLIAKYPVNCLSWHDRWSSVDFAAARKRTDKCFIGGVREVPFYDEAGKQIRPSLMTDGSDAEIAQHIREAIDMVGGRGVIIGPGCVADQDAGEANLHAVRHAVDKAN